MTNDPERIPARDGETPSNYVVNDEGEIWYSPIPDEENNQETEKESIDE